MVTAGCFEVSAAYPLKDIEWDYSSLQDCQNNCKQKEMCKAFTWTESAHKGNPGACNYKRSKRKKGQEMRDGDNLPQRGKVSGTVRNEDNLPVLCEGDSNIARFVNAFQCHS